MIGRGHPETLWEVSLLCMPEKKVAIHIWGDCRSTRREETANAPANLIRRVAEKIFGNQVSRSKHLESSSSKQRHKDIISKGKRKNGPSVQYYGNRNEDKPNKREHNEVPGEFLSLKDKILNVLRTGESNPTTGLCFSASLIIRPLVFILWSSNHIF